MFEFKGIHADEDVQGYSFRNSKRNKETHMYNNSQQLKYFTFT